MTNDQIVILIHRESKEKKEFLLVRPAGETLLQFPILGRNAKESTKQAIKSCLGATLGLEVNVLKRIAVTGYQGPGIGYFSILIYDVEVTSKPRVSDRNEALIWLAKDKIHERISQMSFLMQEAILPCLDEESVWPE